MVLKHVSKNNVGTDIVIIIVNINNENRFLRMLCVHVFQYLHTVEGQIFEQNILQSSYSKLVTGTTLSRTKIH
jgi:hypothetical protein